MTYFHDYLRAEMELPFTPAQVREGYESLKKSTPMLNSNTQRVFFDLAELHQEHLITLDLFQNFTELTGLDKKPPTAYERCIWAVSSMQLAPGHRCADAVNNILADAAKNGVPVDQSFQSIAQVLSLIRDGQVRPAFEFFQEKFLKMNKIEFQKMKVRYFLLALVYYQKIYSEYQIAETIIAKFLKTLPNSFFEQLYEQDQTLNQFFREQTKAPDLDKEVQQRIFQQNFLRVKQMLELSGRTPEQRLQELDGYQEDVHYDEIKILKNFESLNKDYIKNFALNNLKEDLYLLEKELAALKDVSTTKEFAAHKQHQQIREIKAQINKLKGVPEKTPVINDHQEHALSPKVRSLVDLKTRSEQRGWYTIRLKQITQQTLENAIFVHKDIYKQIGYIAELQKSATDQLVQKMMLWGVNLRQPMGIPCALFAASPPTAHARLHARTRARSHTRVHASTHARTHKHNTVSQH